MVQRTHERTIKMRENFISLWSEGFSIKEIAEKYNLSETTVYNHLDYIARASGMNRKQLLSRNFFADHSGRNFSPVKPVNRAEFDKNFAELMEKVEFFQLEIEESIKDMEALNDIYEEEMK